MMAFELQADTRKAKGYPVVCPINRAMHGGREFISGVGVKMRVLIVDDHIQLLFRRKLAGLYASNLICRSSQNVVP